MREFFKQMVIGKYLRSSIFIFAAIFSVAFVTAQVKFTTVASSNEVGRNDYVQIEFIAENAKDIEHLLPPSFPDFKIVEGPIQSSGMSIINGATSQYKGISFVLQPTKTGKFTIQGATATVDGKEMKSNAVTIIVNANSSPNNNVTTPSLLQSLWPDEPAEPSKEYILKPGENIADKIRKNLFVRVVVDKTNCYVGEPIVATYKLYSCLRSESRVTKQPSLNGFSVYDMIDPGSDASSVETLNGKQFSVHVIRKAQLIPLQAGTVQLDPVEVENKVYFIKKDRRSNRRESLLDEMFSQMQGDEGTEVSQDITLDSKPVLITIKPLPDANKPADFNGAVGHFTIDASIENKNIAAKDAATLKVIVKGNGNLPVVNAPAIKWPDSVDAYDPTAKEDVNKTVAPLSGTKTFEYVFSPKSKGDYTLPAIDFSYFDPTTASYKTVESAALNFTASTAIKQKAGMVFSKGETTGTIKNFFQQHLEWFFAVLILSGLALYLWRQNVKLKKTEKKTEPAIVASPVVASENIQLPVPEPVDPLIKARKLLSNGEYNSFYKELNQVLWETVNERLSLPASEWNKNNIITQLKAKGWDDYTISSMENIFNECEMNLYTPNHNEGNMLQLLNQSERIIKYLQEA
ncbi:MAG: protein BatD [Bacteroidetes bacterium]|nr:protein BatD [Bacteroidota bacterium]